MTDRGGISMRLAVLMIECIGTILGEPFLVSRNRKPAGSRSARWISATRMPLHQAMRISARTPGCGQARASRTISARLMTMSRALRTVGDTTRAPGSSPPSSVRFQNHRQAARR